MSRTEPDSAGRYEARLRAAYRWCEGLNARYGRTYHLATKLLPPARRPAVHALYGFARWADDMVDAPPPGVAAEQIGAQLEDLAVELLAGLRRGHSDHAVLAAVVHTASRYHIDAALFESFLTAMRMDLTVTHYPDRAALEEYVHGSAEVIGLQLLPVLGTCGPPAEAAPYAAALGKAFQLTNFLRDVGEDLDRGRVYLPADELASFGVDHELLGWCRRLGRTEPRVRAALAGQHAATREVYRFARDGIPLLHPASRPCVATAFVLYSEILDRIEDSDFAVFTHRASVTKARRVQVAAGGLIRALWARRRGRADRPAGSV